MKSPSRWAYAVPIVIFASAIMLIITQFLGARASLAERVTWLAIIAALALSNIFGVASARSWKRLYRSAFELYDGCETARQDWERLYQEASANRDNWKRIATSVAEFTWPDLPGEEPVSWQELAGEEKPADP